MINPKDLPDRIQIRVNEDLRLKIYELSKYINEDDLSKILKFGISTALHHVKFVTEALVDPDWDVLFQRKRKTHKVNRRVY